MRCFDPFFTVVVLRCTAGLGKLLVLTFLGVHTRLIIYFRYHDETYYALMTMRGRTSLPLRTAVRITRLT